MHLFLSHTHHNPGQPAAVAAQGADVHENRGMAARNDGALPGAPVS
jgi:hypothetical protein